MGLEDCLLSLRDLNSGAFGGVGCDHPEPLNFSFPKTTADPAMSDQISLLPKGVRGYINICKCNSWLVFCTSFELTLELRIDIVGT